MMKKIVATLAALAMLCGFAGCSQTPVNEEPTVQGDSQTGDVAVEDLLWQTEKEEPSLEVTVRWENSDAIEAFAAGVMAKQPVQYETIKTSNGVTQTWRVDYQVDTASLDIELKSDAGETEIVHFDNVALDILPLVSLYMNEEGQVDSYSFMFGMMQSGMYEWYAQNPLVFPNAVYVLIAQTAEGTYLVDYYLHEKMITYIDELLAQAGSTDNAAG